MIYNLGFIEPQISKNVFVAPNATIIGNVEIGRYTSIWFGTIIRGDNETMKIGEGTNIQDNCVLHYQNMNFDATRNPLSLASCLCKIEETQKKKIHFITTSKV